MKFLFATRSVGSAAASVAALALCWAAGLGTAYAYGVGAYVERRDFTCDQPCDFISTSAQDPAVPELSFSTMFSPGSEVYLLSGPRTASATLGSVGSAAADLEYGTLRVFAQAGANQVTNSIAGFSDTVTPLTDGTMHWDIDIGGEKNPGISGILGDANIDGGIFFAIDNTPLKGTRGEYDSDGCISGFSGDPGGSLYGPVQCHYEFDVAVFEGVPFAITLALDGNVRLSTLDLTRTLTIRATGVEFTSESGVFLTQVVPIPAAVWLLGTGLAGLGGRRWLLRKIGS